MSYNCDTFKVKELEDFSIPVIKFFEKNEASWYPDKVKDDDESVVFSYGDQELEGKIEDDIFLCKRVNLSGEGSGYLINKVFKKLFLESKGLLIAVCIWEGGDSVNRLIVKDGVETWENIVL